jgi:hypothetical protein
MTYEYYARSHKKCFAIVLPLLRSKNEPARYSGTYLIVPHCSFGPGADLISGIEKRQNMAKPFKPETNKKTETLIVFGAKRQGVTWLHEFKSRELFDQARAGAKRLGVTLSQLLCGTCAQGPENGPRRFTYNDPESATLKIQITGCDEFTRRVLDRQAANHGCSAEEYIAKAALDRLASDEDGSFLDPLTGEAFDLETGTFIGCKVDRGAADLPPFRRILVPDGAIVESCA